MSGHPLDDFRYEIEQFCTRNIDDLKQDLKPLKGKEVTFAGIVIEANHRVGKNGKPYGSFVVEDYTNFITLTMFSEEYLKWKHLLDEGRYVFLKARIEARYDNPDQLNIRVIQVNLLPEIMEKFARTLTVTVSLPELTPAVIRRLHELAKKHKGRCHLRLRVHDPEEGTVIDLPSKKYRVNPKEMTEALGDLPEVQFHIFGEVN